MTRFDADDPDGWEDLVADAVAAHRQRDSPYLTVEAEDGDPWVQYGDGTLNLDCTDAELSRLTDLLERFPDVEVVERTSPEDADGTNVRLQTHAGPDRVAQFVARAFETVYEHPPDGRLWVAAV